MKKIILSYGAIAGIVIISSITLGLHNGLESHWFGYLIMIIAFSAIFVAIRQYRDQALGGVITFGQGFALGAGITVVAGIFHVAGWELYLASTDYTWMDSYVASLIDAKRESGASAAEITEFIAQTEQTIEWYRNPFLRMPLTFVEILPVGLVVTLISAGVLRNRKTS